MKRHRLDTNHTDIVKALETFGASALSLASVGGGAGDLLVGFRKANYLLEVKSSSKKKLRVTQVKFRDLWRGQYARVDSPEDALRAIGAM